MPLSPDDLAVAVLALLGLLVGVAFLVNRFAPTRRTYLRTPLVLFSAYLAGAGALFLAREANAETALPWLDFATRLAGGFTAVNLFALALVYVVLPAIRFPIPAIMADLLSAFGYAAIVAVVISDTGINPTGAIAGGTVIAAVLSISLQSTFGNVIGGVALQADGSIQVGDWIQVDATRQGRVRSINWRHTVLETREGDSIIMPNSVMLSTPFTILARRDGSPYLHRQTVYFRVDYRFAPSRVCSTVTNALRSTTIANVSGEPAADCVCVDLGRETLQSTALYAARYWILDLTTDGPTDSEVRCRVHASLRREGIPLALPASTVFNASLDHLSGDAQRERRRLRAFQAVRGVELFRSLTDDECQRLASTLTFCPFTAGEIITRQGATAHYLYLLAAGKVEVRIRADDAERAVATIDAPGFFGEMGLLTGAARQASVYALVPCDCFKLDAGAFQTVIRERPEVAGGVAERLARRQVELGVAQQDLGAHAAAAREKNESARLTERIREFFGLEE